jgi:hypothetical protein
VKGVEKHGAWFRPLVRESFALHCGLKILFLRKEQPGKVYQGGDIDGRIKTLLDALTMPRRVEQVLERTGSRLHPIYCLLEEDSLVSGIQVETERLLTDQNHPADYARLIIEVDVSVRQAMIYNQCCLEDTSLIQRNGLSSFTVQRAVSSRIRTNLECRMPAGWRSLASCRD